MIELSMEQWQAISCEELPTIIEPRSQAEYVLVPKIDYAKLRENGSNDADAARILRIVWMHRMGLDEGEIAESLQDDPPCDIHAEMQQIRALDNLDHITPPGEVMRKYAVSY
jgi:hypothetical protein